MNIIWKLFPWLKKSPGKEKEEKEDIVLFRRANGYYNTSAWKIKSPYKRNDWKKFH